jgi:hypothetical protein
VEIVHRVKAGSRGGKRPIAQPEYYDHIIRDQNELNDKAAYVLDNAVPAMDGYRGIRLEWERDG